MEKDFNFNEHIKKYTLDELTDIKSRINKEKYPERYSAVLNEIQFRELEVLTTHDASQDDDLPALYSRLVLRLFSLLFGTIAGGILVMGNIKTLNGDVRSRNNVFAYSLLYLIIITVLMVIYPFLVRFSLLINITGMLPLEYYYWPKYIGKNTKFRRKSATKPFIIWVVITVILLVLFR